MTDRQIQAIRNNLPKWSNGKPPILTDEQKQLDKELNCREMINSILCYDGPYNIINNLYLKKYINELGLNSVQKLCDEQIKDFEKAIVKHNVYTDSEGCSYNAIIWADEQ